MFVIPFYLKTQIVIGFLYLDILLAVGDDDCLQRLCIEQHIQEYGYHHHHS